MLRQIARLQRPPLLQKRQPRTLPRDRAAPVRRKRQRLTPTHAPIVLPDTVVVRLAVREQGSQTPREGIALATTALETAFAIGNQRVLPVGNIILWAFLDDGDAAKGLTQLRTEVFRRAVVDVHAFRFGQPPELDYVGREDAFFTPVYEFRAGLREKKAVCVQDEGDALLPCLGDDGGARVLHEFVAPQAGPDYYDVQAGEHVDYLGGDGFGGFRGGGVFGLAHYGVHH